jgi:hypothetical protein
MSLTIDQAKIISDKYIADNSNDRFSYVFVEVNESQKFPTQWNVVYDIYSAGNTLIDGPLVVVVNKVDGTLRML